MQVARGRVSRKRRREGVHVRVGHRVGRRGGVVVEGDNRRLEKLDVLGKSKDGEAEKLAVDGLGLEPLLLQDGNSAGGILVETSAPDRGA